MIIAYDSIMWAVTALLSLGVSLIALKMLKLSPLWAVLIGMVVFAAIWFPIRTHAVMIKMPAPTTNHV